MGEVAAWRQRAVTGPRISSLASSIALVGLMIATSVAGQSDASRRMLLNAARQADAGNLPVAIEEYEAVAASFPDSPAAAQALLAIAELQFLQGRVSVVGDTTRTLIERFPRSEGVARALVLQVRAAWQDARQLGDLEDLESLLRRVINQFPPTTHPGLAARTQARVLIGELGLLTGDLDAAAAAFLEAMETEPVSEWTSRARLGLARALLARPDRTDADTLAALQALQAAATGAASSDADRGDLTVESRARDLLTLLHRVWIRPRAAQPFWTEVEISGRELRKPRGVDGGPAGSFVVVDASAAYVTNEQGDVEVQPLADGSRPAYGSRGELLLAADAAVRQVPAMRSESFSFVREKRVELDKIVTAARGALGEWLILDRGLGTVAVLSRDERSLRELPADRRPVADLAAGRDGKVYVLLQKEPRVLVYGPDFDRITTVEGAWQRAIALDVDSLGNLYVLDRATRTVEVRDPRGQIINKVGPTLGSGVELRDVVDVAVDDRGRLFVLDAKATGVITLE